MSSDRVAGEHDALRCDTPPDIPDWQQRWAIETTRRHATSPSDLDTLLDMLGLDPQEVQQ